MSALHAQYLEVLGIDLFLPRAAPASAPAAASGAAVGAPQAEVPMLEAPTPGSPSPVVAAAPAVVVARAPAAADDPAWSRLESEVSACTKCTLSRTRTQTVFGVGNRRTGLMLIGEAPGADEDRQGEPFVGRAGQLLDAILRGMGWPRPTVYIANVLKCRPPDNRDPSPEESACCTPYLHRQIELIQPLMILAVGRIAAQNLLATEAPIGKLRGTVHHYGPRRTPLIATYHPSYLLRSPGEKRRVWDDLKFLKAELARARGAAGEAPPGPDRRRSDPRDTH